MMMMMMMMMTMMTRILLTTITTKRQEYEGSSLEESCGPIAIRPFLLTRVLEFGLEARSLHVGASPNDCSEHSTTDQNNIPVIQVETSEGRAEYKQLQSELMARTDPIREQLLANCKAFTRLAFTEEQLMKAALNPSDEQFAKAEPGGLPWKQNLIDRNGSKTKEEETKRHNM